MQSFGFGNLILGLFVAVAGVAGIKYTFQVVNFTGRQQWLERYTGQGTTYFIFKIFFLVVALYGILLFTGLGVPFLNWLLSPLRSIFTRI